ncbi:hypothetical protein [Vibrio vulnificus]|uniref:hypothetical protein n=1 Tax=Vibrio vulnificus TaxID=672 RepID=UPI001A253562|nr:hypothetical protein [Vibrio vulnificus]MCA0765845.1 hypothetical protein [Vibrio vulnificus]MDT9656668.1 hypothetical protein [Vibrio vulnificus]HAT8488804.1 hypothetical protein [Vibrio vulnificus]HAT8544565.1 hypothetical protein [Vibrio vulnificus]
MARFWHFIIRVVVGFAFVVVCCGEYISNAASGMCGCMDPRMRGNDSWWRGGGVLSFFVLCR